MSFTPTIYTRAAIASVIDRAKAELSDYIGDRAHRHDGTITEYIEEGHLSGNQLGVKVAFANDSPATRTGAYAVLNTALTLVVSAVVATGSAGLRRESYNALDDLADRLSQLFDVNRSGWSISEVPNLQGVRRLPTTSEYSTDFLARSFLLDLIIVI